MSILFMLASPTGGGGTVAATGQIIITDLPLDGETVTVGGETFTFKDSPIGDNEVGLGDGWETAASDLNDRIIFLTATTLCTGVNLVAGVIDLTANTPGVGGNSITLTESATNVTVVGFSGGS